MPGEKNPADDATRGLELRDMSTESRWFQGPSFLHEGEKSWPLDRRPYETDCTEEGKQELAKISLTFQSNRSFPLLDADRFSSWLKLLRVTAWIMRFISRCKRARLHRIQASELINSRDRRPAKQLSGESPGFRRNEGRGKVLDSRNSERTLFGRVDDFETRAKCLERQPTVEIVTISRQ